MSVILVIIIIAALVYYLSLKIHPRTRCKRCNSGNRHYDLVYAERRGTCPSCGGSGQRERLGTRLFLGGSR